jgi:hypothetical protein
MMKCFVWLHMIGWCQSWTFVILLVMVMWQLCFLKTVMVWRNREGWLRHDLVLLIGEVIMLKLDTYYKH